MLQAKQANAQAAQNKVTVGLAKIEKQIKKAVKDGKNECYVAGTMVKVMSDALTEAGYTIKQEIGRIKISW